MIAATRRPAARPGLPGLVLTALGVVLAVACAWPSSSLWIEFNWQVGLHLAAQAGFANGADIAFTFGPLGYLGFPDPFLGWTSALATATTTLVLTALATVLVISLRRWLPLPLAIAALLVTMRLSSTVGTVELLETLIFAFAFMTLRSKGTLPVDLLAVAGGLAGAFLLLDKLNTGVAAIAIVFAVAAAVGRPWWRSLVLAAASTAGGTLLLWLVAGQRLDDLPAFGRSALEIVSGYGGAMATAQPGADVYLPPLLLALGMVTILALLVSAGWTSRRRAGLVVAWGIFAGSMLKEGFTRGDVFHNVIFFDAMLITAVVLLPARDGLAQRPENPAARFVRVSGRARSEIAAAFLVVLAIFVVAFGPVSVASLAAPQASIGGFVSSAGWAVRPWSWGELASQTRRQILSRYGLDPSLVPLLFGRTLHIDPIDSALAAGLPGVRWDPEPVFQSYVAYTTWLDELNASFLAGSGAPARIARRNPSTLLVGGRPTSVDGRLLAWEQPAATLEMVCRYRELAVAGRWQVLARTPDRCGAPTAVATVTGAVGQPVSVPAAPADQILIVRISPFQSGLVERASAFVLGSPRWFAEVNGTRYRLVPGTVGDGLLLALPSGVGWSPDFTFGSPIRTIAIAGVAFPPSARLTFVFEAITIAPMR